MKISTTKVRSFFYKTMTGFTEQLHQTYNREITPLARFAQTHPEWNLLVITYEEEDCVTIDEVEIKVIPAYKWMLTDT